MPKSGTAPGAKRRSNVVTEAPKRTFFHPSFPTTLTELHGYLSRIHECFIASHRGDLFVRQFYGPGRMPLPAVLPPDASYRVRIVDFHRFRELSLIAVDAAGTPSRCVLPEDSVKMGKDIRKMAWCEWSDDGWLETLWADHHADLIQHRSMPAEWYRDRFPSYVDMEFFQACRGPEELVRDMSGTPDAQWSFNLTCQIDGRVHDLARLRALSELAHALAPDRTSAELAMEIAATYLCTLPHGLDAILHALRLQEPGTHLEAIRKAPALRMIHHRAFLPDGVSMKGLDHLDAEDAWQYLARVEAGEDPEAVAEDVPFRFASPVPTRPAKLPEAA